MSVMPRTRLSPAPAFAGVTGYRSPRPNCPVDLRLNGNEGIAPPSELLEYLRSCGPDVMRYYPDAEPFEKMLAERHGVGIENVMVTAGADDALCRLFAVMLAPGREVILLEPTFEMLPRYANAVQADIVSLPWMCGEYPIDRVLQAITPKTAVICVVSPNNPTGAVARGADLERLSAATPHALLVADLTYEDFADEKLMPVALRLPNAVAVRTLSKAYGLAGLRVGYAVGPSDVIEWMRAAGNAYPVSSASLAIALARLGSLNADVDAYVRRASEERAQLSELLSRLGCEPYPSQANFVLARFKTAEVTRDALAGLGIAVRLFTGHAELQGFLRITCPGDEQNFCRLTSAVESALAPEAVLLDMDGVLADVSGSYRQAILATAQQFGVSVSAAEVTAEKTKAGSNNDWVVTHRLLAAHGTQVSLQEVTDRFERIYQGAPGAAGLRETEKLLCDVGWLGRLADRIAVGVVTGRPRADATRFLERAGIANLVRVLVCMEDAPAKPDPAPVRLALERLGVRRAWMVGDSPDDIRAARGAGVVPFGIVAPGDDREKQSRCLMNAGAGRVLAAIGELEELLP